MHVFTAVIVPGTRRASYDRGSRLLHRATSEGFDYWGPGGVFAEELVELDLVAADDPWPEAIPVSRLPAPVPEELIPHAFVTPRAEFIWSPIEDEEHPAWVERVNSLIDEHRGSHTLVLFRRSLLSLRGGQAVDHLRASSPHERD